ncbi:MAG: SusC/RagA family TonB-linked outer membrane protein [Chitinophaga sp.]
MLAYYHVIVERLLRKNGRLLMALLLMLGMANGAMAQSARTVTGRVTDEATKQPVPGASISLKGTNIGTASTAEGTFSLNIPAGTGQVLVITSIGFASQEIPLTGSGPLNIVLKQSASTLSDVVVVGYGTQKRTSLTGAVSVVTAKDLEGKPVTSAVQALQGAAPNLIIQQNATEPGAAININVRGVSTVNNTSPLILVDGVPGSLDLLNPNDIESISVLKDAASSAIYGSRAANGVILVTTKKGKANKIPRVTYNGIFGAQQPTFLIKPVSGVEYMQLKNEALVNSGQTAQFSPEQIRRQGEKGSEKWWMDEVMRPAALQHNHNLGVTGAVGKVNYLLSGGYLDQNSLYRGPDYGYQRYNGRANLSTQLGKLKLGGNFAYAKQKIREHAYYSDWLISTAIRIPTIYPIKDTAGQDFLAPTASNNPLAQLEQGGRRRYNNDSYNYMANAEYAITKHLSAKLVYGADVRVNNMDEFRRSIDYAPYSGSDNQSSRTVNHARSIQDNFQALINYGQTFNEKHEVKALLGYATEGWKNEYSQTRRLNVDNNTGDSISGTQTLTGFNDTYDTRIDQWALNSAFGRLNYAFDNKYYFEFNFRYDASSRFAKGNRGAFFPSFSAAWRITDEPFMESLKEKVGDLKLRGSWGRLGNQDVPLYSYYSSISIAQPYWFGGQIRQGAAATSLANQALSWETTTATDFGFDAAFLDQRLSLTGDLYWRETDDILLNVPIPAMVGRAAPFVNAGKVENKGWELEASWRDFLGEVSYNVAFNLSDNRNKVLDLYGTGPYIQGESVVEVGAPINAWYGYESTGFFVNQAEIDAHAQPGGFTTRPGDLIFKDQNGDGVINPDDRVIIGDPSPRYVFGLNVSAKWRNLDVSAFVQGVGKRDQYLALGFIQGPVWENYTSGWHLDYFDPAKNNQGARHPTYYANENRNYYSANSNWILDGSFAKLRNLQVGYSLPASLTERVGADRMRLYLTGKNLWTHSNLGIGLDPEYSAVRGDYYPQTRVFSIGTDLSF